MRDSLVEVNAVEHLLALVPERRRLVIDGRQTDDEDTRTARSGLRRLVRSASR